jgi:MFS family permease
LTTSRAASQHRFVTLARLPRNVLVLGAVSLLTDASSEMIVPLLPAFLLTLPGGGALALGLIEGAADTVASLLKLFSGVWADRLGRHRPIVLMGYGLSSAARPIVALAGAAWHVLLVRVLDRVGKGLRSSPRDALLAGSVPAEQRGFAFGFHRSMDHAGAVVGPLLALAALALWPGRLRLVFWLAAVPAALAFATLALGLRETGAVARAAPPQLRFAPGEKAALLRFLGPLALFTLGNSTDAFLLLRAGATSASLTTLPVLWLALHVVKSVTSPLGGRLADTWGPRRTLALGWIVYAVIYAGFAWVDSEAGIAVLFVTYGLFHGLSEAPEKTLVASLVAADRRGTAFGWYNLTLGVLALPAGLLFGGVWQAFGSSAAFLLGAGLALAALVALVVAAPSVVAAS